MAMLDMLMWGTSLFQSKPRRRTRTSGPRLGEQLETRTLLSAAPVFSPASYSASVDNTAYSGTEVVTVSATDADADPITYSIESGDLNGLFSIDSDDGIISYDGGYYGPTETYTLTVAASDGTGQDTASVTIDVLNTQIFREYSFYFDVDIDVSVGTQVGTVEGYSTTGDPLEFSLVLYGGTVPFDIDDSGNLTTTGSLQNEPSSFFFEVEATDGTATEWTYVSIYVVS